MLINVTGFCTKSHLYIIITTPHHIQHAMWGSLWYSRHVLGLLVIARDLCFVKGRTIEVIGDVGPHQVCMIKYKISQCPTSRQTPLGVVMIVIYCLSKLTHQFTHYNRILNIVLWADWSLPYFMVCEHYHPICSADDPPTRACAHSTAIIRPTII